MEETNVSASQNTVDQSTPLVNQVVIPPPIVVQVVPPTFTNNADIFKKLGAVVFIVIAFFYVGNKFMSSTGDFSVTSMSPKDKPLGGRALYKKISNKAVIKEVRSLTLIDEKEGLIRDNLAVYRCNFIVNTFYDCVVQEKVVHPESFVRVTNIFGKDSEFVYVVDGENIKYKILPGANAVQFRPLYPLDGGVMGLYAGDNSQLYKGDKKIDVGIGSSPYDSMFFKEYRVEDISAISRMRSPYLSLSTNFDGEIQFISDGKNVFHGNGKASTTDNIIRVTKVDEADFATFKPYQQPIKGTGYLKYATDKDRVYCDDVSLGEDGYFVSNELLSTTDEAPSSFQVVYPKQGTSITEQNVGVQIAKTNSQVFVNCALYPEIDATTFKTGSTQNVFTDKNNTYYLTVVASGTTQEAVLSTLPQPEVDPNVIKTEAPSYFIHRDTKEGFSLELPKSFLVKDVPSDRDDLVFFAINKIRTQPYPTAVGISVEKTSITETEIFTIQSNRIEISGFEVIKDEKIRKGGKNIRLLQSKGASTGTSGGIRRMVAIYVGNNKIYTVTSAIESVGWKENEEMMKRLVLSFTLE